MPMKRSRNSYIRAPRSVTAAPIAIPARSEKLEIDFLARVTTGFCPVIAPSSATITSSAFGAFGRLAEADVQHDLRRPAGSGAGS